MKRMILIGAVVLSFAAVAFGSTPTSAHAFFQCPQYKLPGQPTLPQCKLPNE
jgi:hypothetical protein